MFRVCSLLIVIFGLPALAEPMGTLRVIDGDTFDVGGIRVRLFGVDAPEDDQTCTLAFVQPYAFVQTWNCGAWVTAQVDALYDGAQATCETLEIDRYQRSVARCTIGGRDLGQMLVADGLATAYRDYSWDYDLDEKIAQLAELGIWSGGMQTPEDFRDPSTPPPPQVPPGDCPIKGNISNNGQIFHRPGDRSYDDTVIRVDLGERWFCTEAEAQAAGWRAPWN